MKIDNINQHEYALDTGVNNVLSYSMIMNAF